MNPDPGRPQSQKLSTFPTDTPVPLPAEEDDVEPEESNILRGID